MRQRGTMPQRYPARASAGQAGIRTPSMRSSLARSAVAYSVGGPQRQAQDGQADQGQHQQAEAEAEAGDEDHHDREAR